MIDLEQTLLTETLRDLHRSLWSGVVAVTSGDITKGLFLRKGRFVFAASTVEEDRLGEFLVRTGRIRRDQFVTALELAQTPGKRLGQALVEIGAVGELDLEDLVGEQIHMIALSTFRWTSGEARQEEVEEPIPADIALPLSTERLLLEGARTYPDPRRLEQALGDLKRRVQRAENARPAFNYRRVSESRAEKTVLAALRAPKPITELIGLGGPRPALVRAVYALFVGGLLEEVGETPAAGVRAAVSPGVGAPPPTKPALPLVPPPSAPPSSNPPSSPLPLSTPPSATPVPRVVVSPARAAPSPLVRPPASAPRSAPLETPALSSAPPSSIEVEKQARGMLDRGERDRAMEILRREVERNPAARGCRRILALQLSHEPFAAPAERVILEALDDDPEDPEMRYRLAVYYKKAGMAARAILQLKVVVGIDTGHAAAWRDLAELEAGEGAGGKRRRP
jgi:tetratricopeptide (TPR) repeat protein